MKKIISSLVATLAITSVSLNAADYYASVDGDKITKADVALVLQDPRIDFAKLPKNAQSQVLEQIINKKLLAKQAMKDGIENDSSYKDALKKMKQDLAFQVWQKNEIEKVKPSESEMKKFYDENKAKFIVPPTLKASHILLKEEAEAKSIIKQINKASNKKAKFEALAKTKSIGPTGKNGGSLGEFPANQMVPEFSTAAQNMTPGSYSKTPVKTQFGYHVIYLDSKKAGKSLSFNEVKGNISQMLIGNAYNKKVKEVSDKLRKTAKIVIK
ncbi:peptidylprolyl isomerase [Poseidonibacter lekithochrous]|uniref:peptidylprolyl isomerase n=1 Tax=Poseidonibacter TaxID=2321187 RepID=UPI001C092DD7|nr:MULTISPECIES: peptidylprolyl isomerase [Poseidonibacter]MBU3014149.1 peptidylprolyl isomerase [Poseidonibacter lekithochrous]MDO6827447.1 peptidylprolyl isomerase [Poseidonibacter sp. 1_MG-2023]